MKNYIRIPLFLALFFSLSSTAQTNEVNVEDSTGLPGDNFSLEGALELFKNSQNPEDFEKKLNSENTKLNNLDLDGDGKIDYIRVEDKTEGDVHALVLQIDVNGNEKQDVAVIEIEKTSAEKAQLQIIGSSELYGEDKLVEPFDEKEGVDGKGPHISNRFSIIIVNVWFWPCVKFVYAPVYKPWVSPFYWGVYPVWYKPWRPHPWRHYWGFSRPWHYGFRVCHTHRVLVAHKMYAPHKKVSIIVVNKYKVAHGNYKVNKAGKTNGGGKKVGNNNPVNMGKKQNANKPNGGGKHMGGKGQKNGGGGKGGHGGGKGGGGKRHK